MNPKGTQQLGLLLHRTPDFHSIPPVSSPLLRLSEGTAGISAVSFPPSSRAAEEHGCSQIQAVSPHPLTPAAYLCFTGKPGAIFTAMKFFRLKAPFFSFCKPGFNKRGGFRN